MAFQPESATWEAGVFQIEIATPVLGGVGGPANTPLLHLANRTLYLKGQVDTLNTAVSGLAPLNSPGLTGSPTTPDVALGDRSTKIANTKFVQDTLDGILTKSVAGGVDVTLTAVEAGNGIIVLTGAITADINVNVPVASHKWIVANQTSGAFAVTFKTIGGTGVIVTQGRNSTVWCDATNIQQARTDFISVALTGAPTAPTAGSNDNSTKVATTAYVDSAVAGATGVAAASETVAGKVELATAAETATGTDNTRAVHPSGLASVLGTYAPINSPGLTGNPTATTQTAGNNTTRLATTAFVQTAVAGISISSASETVQGKVELATAAETATGTDNTRAVHPAGMKSVTDLLAPKASPALTGTPTAPTAADGTNTTQLATTAYVQTALAGFVPNVAAASETVQGKVELATAAETATGTDNTRAVHPAGLLSVTNLLAPKASPALTGNPTAPTQAYTDDSTRLATTSYVTGAGASLTVFSLNSATSLAGIPSLYKINAAGSPAMSLFSAGGTKVGTLQAFVNLHASGTPLISRQGTDTIKIGNTSANSVTLKPGSTLLLVSDGNSTWTAVGGSASLTRSDEFAHSIGSSAGYQKLPGGLLMQWTQFQIATPSVGQTVTFPTSFANSAANVFTQAINGNGTAVQAWHNTPTATSVLVFCDSASFVDVFALGAAP